MKHPDDIVTASPQQDGHRSRASHRRLLTIRQQVDRIRDNMISEGVDIPRLQAVMVYMCPAAAPSCSSDRQWAESSARTTKQSAPQSWTTAMVHRDAAIDEESGALERRSSSSPSSLEEDMGRGRSRQAHRSARNASTEGERPRAGSLCKTCGHEPRGEATARVGVLVNGQTRDADTINVGGMTCHSVRITQVRAIRTVVRGGHRRAEGS